MKIVFTKHARKRFIDFAKTGVHISKQAVVDTLKTPEHVDHKSDSPKIIASKSRSVRHVIRVVYKIEGDIITVITFYPANKGRYYET